MISRRLVRIKAVQTYYAFVQGNYDGSLEKVWEALEMSINKSYELFIETFCLIVAIADHAEYKIEFNRNKLLPTEEDLNPNRKFVDNKIIQAFRTEPTIKKYMEKDRSNWSEHYEFVRGIFNKMSNSEFYKKYMDEESQSIKQDADMICKIVNKYLVDNPDLDVILEGESIYWNDDIEFSLSNLIQTIKKLNDENIENFRLPAMFRIEEDREFAKKLIKDTCLYRQKFDELIEKNLEKWELQRIAFMRNDTIPRTSSQSYNKRIHRHCQGLQHRKERNLHQRHTRQDIQPVQKRQYT